MKPETIEDLADSITNEDATRFDFAYATEHERSAYRETLVAQYKEESEVPDGPGKDTMCRALANTKLVTEYLQAKLNKEGELNGENIRVYTASNSAMARLCVKLGIGTLDAKGAEDDKEF